MSWLIDNASVVYLVLVCAALALTAGWWATRKRHFLIGLGAVAGLAGLVFLLTLVVDTDRKRIERALEEMVEGVRKRDLDRTFALIADDCKTEFIRGGAGRPMSKPELRELAERAVRSGGVQDITLWNFDFESVDPPRAVVAFNAKPFGKWAGGYEYCGCRAEFRLERGRWRMTRLTLFKPGSTELLKLPF